MAALIAAVPWVTVLTDVCQATLVAALFSGALLKATSISEFRGALVAIGLPVDLVRPLGWAVVGTEAAVAVALVAMPAAAWPRLLAVCLALVFAGVGVRVLAGGRAIACGCFGSVGRRNLGWAQIIALPIWLGLAAVAQARPPVWSWDQGVLGLTVLVGVLLVWRSVAEMHTWRVLRGDRIAVNEAIASMNVFAEQLQGSTR